MCSHLHRYNITGLQPFVSSSSYQLTIRAINDIGMADISEPVPIRLVDRSEIKYHCVSVANVLLFVTVEAAVQNLSLAPLNNSEVIATWDVNPDLFELSFFNATYFHEQREISTVTINSTTYQISDLIPGETYTVQVTAYYSVIFPSDTIQETVILDKIGMLT